jgi:hypothetical protein
MSMVMRWIIRVFGALLILIGLSEIVLPGWVTWVTRRLIVRIGLFGQTDYVWLRLGGLVMAALGVTLIVAYLRRLIGLRLFVLILGIYAVAGGLVMFAAPPFMVDVLKTVFLNRGPVVQATVLWTSGLIRMAIGVALIYALAKTPQSE